MFVFVFVIFKHGYICSCIHFSEHFGSHCLVLKDSIFLKKCEQGYEYKLKITKNKHTYTNILCYLCFAPNFFVFAQTKNFVQRLQSRYTNYCKILNNRDNNTNSECPALPAVSNCSCCHSLLHKQIPPVWSHQT